MHFLLHGCHHKHPMDPLRLVFPPAAAALPVLGLLGVAVLLGERTGSPSARAALLAAHAGTVAGYVAYDLLHYRLHHCEAASAREAALQRGHISHHFKDGRAAFSISTTWLDAALGTAPVQRKRAGGGEQAYN